MDEDSPHPDEKLTDLVGSIVDRRDDEDDIWLVAVHDQVAQASKELARREVAQAGAVHAAAVPAASRAVAAVPSLAADSLHVTTGSGLTPTETAQGAAAAAAASTTSSADGTADAETAASSNSSSAATSSSAPAPAPAFTLRMQGLLHAAKHCNCKFLASVCADITEPIDAEHAPILIEAIQAMIPRAGETGASAAFAALKPLYQSAIKQCAEDQMPRLAWAMRSLMNAVAGPDGAPSSASSPAAGGTTASRRAAHGSGAARGNLPIAAAASGSPARARSASARGPRRLASPAAPAAETTASGASGSDATRSASAPRASPQAAAPTGGGAAASAATPSPAPKLTPLHHAANHSNTAFVLAAKITVPLSSKQVDDLAAAIGALEARVEEANAEGAVEAAHHLFEARAGDWSDAQVDSIRKALEALGDKFLAVQ